MQCVNTVEFCLLLTQLERRCFGGKRMHAKSSKFTKYGPAHRPRVLLPPHGRLQFQNPKDHPGTLSQRDGAN